MLAGFIMSMGAGGGGILAGIGHMSILGIADANMIKVVNQILEFASRAVAVPLYQRQRRIVWRLALPFGAGASLGAVAGSWFSKEYLSDMAVYRPVFGVLVVLVAARVLYEGWRMSAPRAGAAAPRENRWAAAAGGFGVSFVGAMLGVAGGFLATPFMASVLLFPMYLVLGTSLVALMIPLTVSVATYVALGVRVDWLLVAVEVPGIVIGSVLGPPLNRAMNERALKAFVAAVLLALGLYYLIAD
ncbi:MAG TPA: sulfite exporter TauE/SafE family protein [Burkholderiales bacterium]